MGHLTKLVSSLSQNMTLSLQVIRVCTKTYPSAIYKMKREKKKIKLLKREKERERTTSI